LCLAFKDKSQWCPGSADTDGDPTGTDPYENPDYISDPCYHTRLPQLFGLTLENCDISRRMIAAVIFGGLIGYERRSADRPAGVRTMGLVSLGACFFTISSIMAFKSSTMGWDASRVTAALPSGVGFLGGALIWKGSISVDGSDKHQVHGLTTAASLWLSAAVGVGAGGALYVVTSYATILVIFVLKYGPKMYNRDIEEEEENKELENMGPVPQSIPERQEFLRSVSERLRRRKKSIPTFGS
jgi:putative Mg2+ transporter-C (MgtC) family protein